MNEAATTDCWFHDEAGSLVASQQPNLPLVVWSAARLAGVVIKNGWTSQRRRRPRAWPRSPQPHISVPLRERRWRTSCAGSPDVGSRDLRGRRRSRRGGLQGLRRRLGAIVPLGIRCPAWRSRTGEAAAELVGEWGLTAVPFFQRGRAGGRGDGSRAWRTALRSVPGLASTVI